jgi:hypothetical protein
MIMNYPYVPPEFTSTVTTPHLTPPALMRRWEREREIGSVSFYIEERYAEEWHDTAAVYPKEIERYTARIIDEGPIVMRGLPGEFADEE